MPILWLPESLYNTMQQNYLNMIQSYSVLFQTVLPAIGLVCKSRVIIFNIFNLKAFVCMSGMRCVVYLIEDQIKNSIKIETDLAVLLAKVKTQKVNYFYLF